MRKDCTILGLVVTALAGCGGSGPRIEPINNGLNYLAAEDPQQEAKADTEQDLAALPDPASASEPTDAWAKAAVDLQELQTLLNQERSAEMGEGEGETIDQELVEENQPSLLLADASLQTLTTDPTDPTETVVPPGMPSDLESETQADAETDDASETLADASSIPEVEVNDPDLVEQDQRPNVLATNSPSPEDIARMLQDMLLERAADGVPADAARAALLAAALGLPDDELDAMQFHPAERARIDAARAFVRSFIESDATNEQVLERLESLSEDLASSSNAFRVREAKLCTEVRAFADYTPITDTTFLAGIDNHLIVYTEPDRFSCRQVTTEGQPSFEVEISQQLTLYHDAPGELQVWHQPRARILENSRRKRRDFYLVNEIELPARLSVGSYLLKVSTRDEVSGAIAERTIPIRIVADPALAHAGG